MRSILIVVCFAVSAVGSADAEDQSLKLINDYGEPVYLWQHVAKDWDQPPTFFRLGGDGYVDLKRPGAYFLLLQDLAQRNRDIGRKDLHPVYDIDPKATLRINQLFAVERGTRILQQWNCHTRRWEQREIVTEVRKATGEPVLYVESGGKVYHFDDFLQRGKQQPGKR